MTLSEDDLERIETAAFNSSSAHNRMVPSEVAALVEEVRRLRAMTSEDAWTEKPTTLAEALDNLTAENWHTARALIEAALQPPPTPLDTGRWERDGESFVLTPPGGALGLFLSRVPVYEYWEVAREADEYSVRVTADDFDAAAAIIRNEESKP